MRIRQNIAALSANNQLEINNKKRQKSTEKLASGSRINRAADNAAGLAISEKFRQQIRGLRQAGNNAEDGIKFINVADGAMSEVSGILHRMKELSVASLNGTYTESDQAIMEMEFNELQSEIDQTFKSSEFNKQKVFEQHGDTYYSILGNRYWDHAQDHRINSTNSNLVLSVPSKTIGEVDEQYEIKVPFGTYTTQELVDEIENAFEKLKPPMPGFTFEYTKDGFCNFNYEGGEVIKNFGGGLSYLIFENYNGGTFGSLLGTTEFVAEWPLSVTPYNDELTFYIDSGGNERNVSIKIASGDYTRKEMIEYLNKELKNQSITDITTKEYGDLCIEVGGNGRTVVTGLKGNMFQIDDGFKYTSVFYDNIKYGHVSSSAGYFNGDAYFKDTDKITITSANNTLKIKVNSGSYVEITLDDDDYTVAEMIEELNDKFKANNIKAKAQSLEFEDFKSISIFSEESGTGSKIEIDPASKAYETLFTKTSYYYKSDGIEPKDGEDRNTPPELYGNKVHSGDITINNTNNTLNLDIDGTIHTLTLEKKKYDTVDDIIQEINDKIGNSSIQGKIKAEKVDGKINFMTVPNNKTINSIKFATDPGNAYKDLFTHTSQEVKDFSQYAYGTRTLGPQIKFDFDMITNNVIDNSNNTFTITIDGVEKTITLENGSHTPEKIAEMMNKQLKGYTTTFINDVTLFAKGYQSVLEGTTIPSEMVAAEVVLPFDLIDVSKINSTNNTFSLKVNGDKKTITLSEGTYTRAELVEEINEQFRKGGIEATASLNGNKLQFATVKKGKNASIEIKTSEGDSAMSVIAGSTTKVVSGVTATIEGKKLVLTGNNAGSDKTISFNSGGGGSSSSIFVGTEERRNHARSINRQIIEKFAQIDGESLGSGNIVINDDNNNLKFQYNYDATEYEVHVTLDSKTYTHAALKSALQTKIDAITGAILTVTVDENGVKIQARDAGAQYVLSEFSGNFYECVISGSKTIERTGTPNSYEGTQFVDTAYAMGRKDVKNDSVKIETGKNDSLVLDFTMPDKTVTLKIKLDAGTYQGETLIREMQKQLNKALRAQGLKENTIEVNIGKFSSGVVGSNDKNALNFELAPKNINLESGTYSIDGIRGSAAYHLFYLTEGESVPAHATGAKNIENIINGINIPADKNEFSFVVDNKKYSYKFPPKNYTSEEFMKMFNDLIKTGKDEVPFKLNLKDGHLNIFFDDLGRHDITNIGGSAKGIIFFNEEGRVDEDTSFKLQIGANEGNLLNVGKIKINTCYMKINAIAISGRKYAEKALKRLDFALNYLSQNQGDYGAKSNRLEHIIKNNANTGENLQAAESQLRDTDMAKEMMENIKANILSQAAQSMLAQAQKIPEGILAFLP